MPGLGPGTPFRLPLVAGGGASELLSVAAASAPGAGVSFDSEVASAAGALIMGVETGAGEAVGDDSDLSSNLASSRDARRRTTVLDCFVAVLAVDLDEGVVAMVGWLSGWIDGWKDGWAIGVSKDGCRASRIAPVSSGFVSLRQAWWNGVRVRESGI